MKKLYYTCPIEAAYMAKNYDVEICTSKACLVTYDWKEIIESFVNIDGEYDESLLEEKYFIHPDSLSIFEPQEGDLVEIETDHPKTLNYPVYSSYLLYSEYLHLTTYEDGFIRKLVKIIQRNGKPFSMPQEEK